MKKHKMNKSVMHDGKNLKKDEEIDSSHPAFEPMKSQGHLDEMNFKDGDAAAPDAPEFPAEGEAPDEESASGKKHGRRR